MSVSKTEVTQYEDLPVYSDFPKSKAKRIVAGDHFVKCANQAMDNVRKWWKIRPVGLVLDELGVIALTSGGDKLLVRFDKPLK